MRRPKLHEISLKDIANTGVIVTMSPGQWDKLLSSAYRAGYVLLELDRREQPVKAYQRVKV